MAAERKLLFFLAWANEQPQEAYGMLAMAVEAEGAKHQAAAGAAAQGSAGGGPGLVGALAGSAAESGAQRRPAGVPGPLVEELQ